MTTAAPITSVLGTDRPSRMRPLLIAMVVLTAIIGLTFFFLRNEEHIPKGIAQAVMPDGTILVLRAVLFDPQDEFIVRRPFVGIEDAWHSRLRNKETILSSGEDRCIRYAMSRHDPVTGASLDFVFLSHFEVEDHAGNVLRDGPESTYFHEADGWRGSAGSAVTEAGPPIPRERGYRILTFRTYRFSAAGPATLRAVNKKNETIASFEIPVPLTYRSPADDAWEQNTNSEFGRIKMAMERLNVSGRADAYVMNGRPVNNLMIHPDVRITVDDLPMNEKHWDTAEKYVTDSLGNIASFASQRLPAKQQYWDFHWSLVRTTAADFAPSEVTRLGEISVPLANKVIDGTSTDVPLIHSFHVLGRDKSQVEFPHQQFGEVARRDFIRFWSYCGNGIGSLDTGYLTSGGGSGGGGDYDTNHGLSPKTWEGEKESKLPEVSIQANWTWRTPTTELTFHCDLPILLLTTEPLSSSEYLLPVVHDDQQRRITVYPLPHPYRQMPLYALDVYPDSKTLIVGLVREQQREIVFRVSPPTQGLDMPYTGSFEYKLAPAADGWRVLHSDVDPKEK